MKEANVKIYLKNFEDLMYFLNVNYEHIDEVSYKALLENTLGIYAEHKPLDKDEALTELTEFYETYSTNKERPLFIHNTNKYE
jgi:hypothetical protein